MKPKYFKVEINSDNRPAVLVPKPRVEPLRNYLHRQGVSIHIDFKLAEQVHSVAFLNTGKEEATRLIREWSDLPWERQQ